MEEEEADSSVLSHYVYMRRLPPNATAVTATTNSTISINNLSVRSVHEQNRRRLLVATELSSSSLTSTTAAATQSIVPQQNTVQQPGNLPYSTADSAPPPPSHGDEAFELLLASGPPAAAAAAEDDVQVHVGEKHRTGLLPVLVPAACSSPGAIASVIPGSPPSKNTTTTTTAAAAISFCIQEKELAAFRRKQRHRNAIAKSEGRMNNQEKRRILTQAHDHTRILALHR
mmetsp:Transcript_16293/g.27534  ORF Transcript_16293/g.27534 Transcript_16293/m.27534 type:complete len:229 (-) Transcript_16293:278-964(-)